MVDRSSQSSPPGHGPVKFVSPGEPPAPEEKPRLRSKRALTRAFERLFGAPWDEAEVLNRDFEQERALAGLYRRYATKFHIRHLEPRMLRIAEMADRQIDILEQYLRQHDLPISDDLHHFKVSHNPLEVLGQLWEWDKDLAETYHQQRNNCEEGDAKRLLGTLLENKHRQTQEMRSLLDSF